MSMDSTMPLGCLRILAIAIFALALTGCLSFLSLKSDIELETRPEEVGEGQPKEVSKDA